VVWRDVFYLNCGLPPPSRCSRCQRPDYYLAPEVILGTARGHVVEPARLRQIFRLRQQTRQVRRHGQIRLHNFGLYVDRRLRGQTVKVLMYDEALRIEQAKHLLV
jgi:hypothetical protein